MNGCLFTGVGLMCCSRWIIEDLTSSHTFPPSCNFRSANPFSISVLSHKGYPCGQKISLFKRLIESKISRDIMACHFLRLSAELRNIIYDLALIKDDPINLWSGSEDVDIVAARRARQSTGSHVRTSYRGGDPVPVAAEILAMRQGLAVNLLRTCKKINAEATPMFYGGNDFRFTMEDGWLPLYYFLTTIRKSNRGHIKRLSVFVPVEPMYYLLRSSMAATPSLGEVARRTSMDIPVEPHAITIFDAIKGCCELWMEEKTLQKLFLVMPAGLHVDRDAFMDGIFEEFRPLMDAEEEVGLDISLVIHENASITPVVARDSQRAVMEIEEDWGRDTLVQFRGDHRYYIAVSEEVA